MINRRCTFVVLAALIVFAGAQCAWAATHTWLGINSSWADTQNWDTGVVPTAAGDTAVVAASTNNPVMDVPATALDVIEIDGGTTLTFTTAAQLGSATLNMASFDGAAGGTLLFSGTSPETIGNTIQWCNSGGTGTINCINGATGLTVTGPVSGLNFRQGGAVQTINYTGNLTISGNISLGPADNPWGGGVADPNSVSHITGTWDVRNGTDSGIFNGGTVEIAGDGKINQLNGNDRVDAWGHGKYVLSGNGQLNTAAPTPSAAANWIGSILVNSWNPGFQGMGGLFASGDSQVNVQNFLTVNAWGCSSSMEFSGNAALNVGWHTTIGGNAGGFAHASVSDNATMQTGELYVGTSNTDSHLNLSGTAALTTVSGAIIFTDNIDTANTLYDTVASGNIILGNGDGSNFGQINVADSASLVIATGSSTGINLNSSVNVTSDGTVSLGYLYGVGVLSVDGGANVDIVNFAGNTLVIGNGTITLATVGAAPQGGALNAVPEPSTIVMLTMAAVGLAWAAWRRK